MSRWEPNAKERLQAAAMELYAEHGYDETTVADIAKRAGLTERTFFRYFADKREVLFAGSERLEEFVLQQLHAAPQGTAPLELLAQTFAQVSPFFEERRKLSPVRRALILAHPDLMEREVAKLTSLGRAVGKALRERGMKEPAASLTAEMGMAIFKVGFEHWVTDTKHRDFAHHIHAALEELRGVVGGSATKASARARRR